MSSVIKSTYVNVLHEKTFKFDYNFKETNIKTCESSIDFTEVDELLNVRVNKEQSEEIEILDIIKIQEEADRIIEEAKIKAEAEAKEIKNKILAEIELEKAQIYAEAKESGYQQGYNQALEENKEYVKESKKVLEDAIKEKEDIINQVEPKVVDLIYNVSKKIMYNEIKLNKKSIIYLFRSGFDKVNDVKNIKLRVSKEDSESLSSDLNEIKEIIGNDIDVDIIIDNNFVNGDCIIETSHGNIDCSLENQLGVLYKELNLILNANQ